MRGLADTSRLIDGKHASLASIGYSDAGIGEQRTSPRAAAAGRPHAAAVLADDGWMKCGDYGPEKYRYHSALGDPVIDGRKFPDLRSLTDLAHSLGLTAGWYGNACGCAAQAK